MIDKIMTEKISLVKGTSFMVRQVLQWAFEYEIHWSYNITCKHLALRIVKQHVMGLDKAPALDTAPCMVEHVPPRYSIYIESMLVFNPTSPIIRIHELRK